MCLVRMCEKSIPDDYGNGVYNGNHLLDLSQAVSHLVRGLNLTSTNSALCVPSQLVVPALSHCLYDADRSWHYRVFLIRPIYCFNPLAVYLLYSVSRAGQARRQ